ncbi:GNAT family N-acetyltransferase [Bacillus sp. ISL-40]|uniref:GNAT family N-acetyltransferase n=1 Tax=unclassified Bacillus (in: firmicutes) TaxID=185979 RepID=UPI001BE86DA3|nr:MULTISPECIES: GNAT family N-acetyltransferase [unclassified Bacillus (in: firmicutes)]MBT2699819.1 GNAT family N-acetyltransferase [Bacillus sp. ISL-40]MBT2721933.1 GNAT family N-acetyltransferase [Bacillus sp. ISL-46]MBT2743290.1 GNAT family N-acetyltransferase [Bacillus sp. ISL-77]
MEYIRITNIDDQNFRRLHNLMGEIFPPEEVLAYELWKEPLEDPSIRVFVAVDGDKVLGATEYRYYPDWNIAMTDFTIISQPGLSLGRFLAQNRLKDLQQLAKENGQVLFGMFAEIYDPYRVEDHEFGGVRVMDPYIRREVLSHLGYKRIDFSYVHPSWENNGEVVTGLDLCFMPLADELDSLPANLVKDFLTTYYSILSNKPEEWLEMIDRLGDKEEVSLLPL